MPDTAVFQVLYTPNLTQKRKKWFDGFCTFMIKTNKVRLTDSENRLVAEQFWRMRAGDSSTQFPEEGTTLAFERFVVEIDSFLRSYDSKPAEIKTPERIECKPRLSSTPTKLQRNPRPPIALTAKSRISMMANEPPLDEILKESSVRVMKPLNFLAFQGKAPNDDTLLDTNSTKRRRKYAPWGDQFSPEAPEQQEPAIDDTAFSGNEHSFPTYIGSYQPKISPDEERQTCSIGDQVPNFDVDGSPGRDEEESLFVDPLPLEFPTSSQELEPSTIIKPMAYDLESDLESETELEITDVMQTTEPRKSLFQDIPNDPPTEGPWTKEAYLLFSWHPPNSNQQVTVKQEVA